jgi:hypothetical protein
MATIPALADFRQILRMPVRNPPIQVEDGCTSSEIQRRQIVG